jgi:chromosome segregation ATPase
MDDPTTDDNPLTVDMAMELIGKWETHPGLLMAIFDASRKLRDEVERLRDNNVSLMARIGELGKQNSAMQSELTPLRVEADRLFAQNVMLKSNLEGAIEFARVNAKRLVDDKSSSHTEVEQLRDELQRSNDWGNAVAAELQSTQRKLGEHRTMAQEAYNNLYMQWSASQHELEQLRAVVAANNQSIAGIVLSWIKPSRN